MVPPPVYPSRNNSAIAGIPHGFNDGQAADTGIGNENRLRSFHALPFPAVIPGERLLSTFPGNAWVLALLSMTGVPPTIT